MKKWGIFFDLKAGFVVLPQLIKNGGTTVIPKVAFPKNEMNFLRLYCIFNFRN